MTKKIFIDTDCISAFLWVKNESLLTKLYPDRIVMPKPVYDEIDRPQLAWMKQKVDKMISDGNLVVIDLKAGSEEFDLYYKMTQNPDSGYKIIGDGEASSRALAKVKNGIVASNNFRDILTYINDFGLENKTTGDILVEAYNQGLIDENQGNAIWSSMISKKRKIGANSFTEYLNRHKNMK